MDISINLPVTPAIKKYLTIKLGSEYRLTSIDWFGSIVFSMLENKTKKHNCIKDVNISCKTGIFQFTMSYDLSTKIGFILSPKHETMIHNIVDRIFRDEIYYTAIRNKEFYDIEYQTSINDILDSYDIIDEDITWDALYKEFTRKKKNIKSRLYL